MGIKKQNRRQPTASNGQGSAYDRAAHAPQSEDPTLGADKLNCSRQYVIELQRSMASAWLIGWRSLVRLNSWDEGANGVTARGLLRSASRRVSGTRDINEDVHRGG